MAEMFVALMGERSGEFSRDRGLERLRTEVKSRTPKSGVLNLVDGSGLSPANRISAKVVCDTLAQEYRNPDTQLTFFASLPQFGISGTMKRRLRTISGRAKTGSLSNVSSLAGIVYARTEPLVFAIIQNQVSDLPRAKAAEDVLVEKFSKL